MPKKTSKTTLDNLDDRMSEIYDIQQVVNNLVDAISTAESVEKPEDFDANLDEAETLLKTLSAMLTELRAS